MDDTAASDVDTDKRASDEYRLRFRYELWTQASRNFQPPAACKRFASIVVNGTPGISRGDVIEPDAEASPAAMSGPSHVS